MSARFFSSAPDHTMNDPRPARLDQLVADDPRMRRAVERATAIADTPIALLLEGEPGVGKGTFAEAFHRSGPRAARPFVRLHCAALSASDVDTLLFGSAPAAGTPTARNGGGRILAASGGTLFIDAVGELPAEAQLRLLQVLREGQVVPPGSAQAVAVDLALVCASGQHLPDAVAAGRFREDLYFTLNGLTITLPALRTRSDRLCIARTMLARHAPRRALILSPPVVSLIEQHPWPGNLRQLDNMLKVAVALVPADQPCIGLAHLPEDVVDTAGDPHAPGGGDLRATTRWAIDAALARTGGNVSAAARLLGISRNTLYRRLAPGPDGGDPDRG